MKSHWDQIYTDKSELEVSWFQKVPSTSLQLIEELQLKPKDAIIDVGGGNSNLAWHLIDKGFKNLSVLDISGVCLAQMKDKIGEQADQIHWIESDIVGFKANHNYKLWHDRAVFHFLKKSEDRLAYKQNLQNSLGNNGYFILSTFSVDGPSKCSGLNIIQYDLPTLKSLFGDSFELLNVFNEDHITPAPGKLKTLSTPYGKRSGSSYLGSSI